MTVVATGVLVETPLVVADADAGAEEPTEPVPTTGVVALTLSVAETGAVEVRTVVNVVPFAVSVHNVVYVVNWDAESVAVEFAVMAADALLAPVPCGAVTVGPAVEEALAEVLEPVTDREVEVTGAD